jgi:hypothetical protein
MLNTDLNVSQEDHDAKKDVATISIKPAALPAARAAALHARRPQESGRR